MIVKSTDKCCSELLFSSRIGSKGSLGHSQEQRNRGTGRHLGDEGLEAELQRELPSQESTDGAAESSEQTRES